jgi:hypothetical protein
LLPMVLASPHAPEKTIRSAIVAVMPLAAIPIHCFLYVWNLESPRGLSTF